MMRNRKQKRTSACAIWGLSLFSACVSSAQVLRLGPVDFNAETSLEAIYTTNVEGQRPSQATKEREDYYFTAALTLTGDARVSPNTDITVDTEFEVEKHMIRKDLDNENAPFGRLTLGSSTKMGHSTFSGDIEFKRNDETFSGFMPGDRKEVQPNNEFNYGIGWAWDWKNLRAGADYSFDHTRYDDEEFQDGDKDSTEWGLMFAWQFTRRLTFEFTYDRSLDDYKYAWERNAEWDTEAQVDIRYQVFEKPSLSVYAGFTKDSKNSTTQKWYPTVGADFSAILIETRTVELSVDAAWEHVKDIPEDSKLTYGAELRHQISRTAEHSLSITEEPVDTFGSNKDTDQTSVDYSFKKNDLFIYNLNLTADLKWKEDRPIEDEENPDSDLQTERTFTWEVALAHNRALSRKLRRELKCMYKSEKSNLEDELLNEFEATLKFTYTF